jgi:hypothetical protein
MGWLDGSKKNKECVPTALEFAHHIPFPWFVRAKTVYIFSTARYTHKEGKKWKRGRREKEPEGEGEGEEAKTQEAPNHLKTFPRRPSSWATILSFLVERVSVSWSNKKAGNQSQREIDLVRVAPCLALNVYSTDF